MRWLSCRPIDSKESEDIIAPIFSNISVGRFAHAAAYTAILTSKEVVLMDSNLSKCTVALPPCDS